jgi:nucleoside-diphosphate-sugar epimerase
VTLVSGDIRDRAVLERACPGVEVVFHLAGVADPRACARDPETAHAINVGGTEAVVRAATGCRLVFLSSATLYLPSETPVDEQAPVGETSPYAATKRAAERVCLAAHERGEIDAVVVRNFNTYGPGQEPPFLVPELIAQGLRGPGLQIASCRPVRDFTYVDDAVGALVALATTAATGVFNLGSGCGLPVGDVALALGRLLGVAVACGHAPLTGNAQLVATNGKLRTATGWEPQVDLTEGLTRTIAWWRARPGRLAAPC